VLKDIDTVPWALRVYTLNKPLYHSTVQREHQLGLEHGEALKQTVKQTANDCDILSHLIALNDKASCMIFTIE